MDESGEGGPVYHPGGAGCISLAGTALSAYCVTMFTVFLLWPPIRAGRAEAWIPLAPGVVGTLVMAAGGVVMACSRGARQLLVLGAAATIAGALVSSWGTCWTAFVATELTGRRLERMLDWVEPLEKIGKPVAMLWLFAPIWYSACVVMAVVSSHDATTSRRRRHRG